MKTLMNLDNAPVTAREVFKTAGASFAKSIAIEATVIVGLYTAYWIMSAVKDSKKSE